MKKQLNVGILGATGAVGREMLRILEERELPLSSLRLFSSERSAGAELAFKGSAITVEKADIRSFEGLDLVLGAADNDAARSFAPAITDSGALFIDNSSAFRLDPAVPLVIPEINPEDAFLNRGIISNPNCVTIIALTAIGALLSESEPESITASSYQAVSGAGAAGLEELTRSMEAYLNGRDYPPLVFDRPIACNLIPKIGETDREGWTAEEMKMQNEGRKILHRPDLRVSCTCVRVPVMRSHSVSLTLRTKKKISLSRARELLSAAPGVRLCDDTASGIYPTPLSVSGRDEVSVGRLRRDLTSENGLCLFCCGDQLRKGAALNAIQIAELVFGQSANKKPEA